MGFLQININLWPTNFVIHVMSVGFSSLQNVQC